MHSNAQEHHKSLIRAAWIAPGHAPPFRDGALVHQQGRILDVGDAQVLIRLHPEAQRIDRSDSVILPGLVNAHTHLELSASCRGPRSGDFVDWVQRLIPRGPIDPQSLHESVAQSIAIGVAQCLQFGVTCVGDISRQCAITRPLLRDGPLRAVSYGEIQAMAQRRGFLEERLRIASDHESASGFLQVGISPHAAYSVEMAGYRCCLEVAQSRQLPLATHLAETADERPFLENHASRFRDLWDGMGAWDDSVPRFAGGPIRFARAIGLLDYSRTLLAHVNWCDDEELALLAAGSASVVYCPRTHAYFGHPPHRWREMLARGINVALGTDSCASSPDLNLVDDLRSVHQLAPDVPAGELWKLVTVNGAKAVGLADHVGTLHPGRAADFVIFPTKGDDPLAAILDDEMLPQETWIDGAVRDPAPTRLQNRER